MRNIKNEKGITLIELTLTIVVMMILTVTITMGIDSTLELRAYNAVKADVVALTEEVHTYYLENGKLPIASNATAEVFSVPSEDKNPNDNETYYKIDTSLLSNVTIQCKNKTYLVNEQSLTVYCKEGIEFNGKTHYTIIDNIDGTLFAKDYYTNADLPIISVVTFESNNVNSKYYAKKGDVVTLKILANYNITPTVTINGTTVDVSWDTDKKIGTATYTVGDISTPGSVLPFSISAYSANGVSGEEITKPTFTDGIILYIPVIKVGEMATENSTVEYDNYSSSNPIVPQGYIPINTDSAKWDETTGPEYNNGLVITDSISNGNEWVWVPVDASTLAGMYETASSPIAITGGSGKTYISGVETSKYSKGGIISGKTRVLPNDTSSFREPDVVVESSDTSYDAVESYRKTAGFTKTENGTKTTMSLSEMAKTMVNEYETMIASIAKYGGFYIGRYELTANGEKPGVTLTESSWYTLYGKCKELEASEKVQTRMIWGCQWDVTCNWIASTNEDKSITDSRSWGNYKDSISPANTGNYEQGVKKDTGSNEAWKANNIYDFAGNCFEWTQEAHRTSNRAGRGGSKGSSGSDGPATGRRTYVPTFNWDSGIRFPSRFNSATMRGA